jgi:hypothetical protein
VRDQDVVRAQSAEDVLRVALDELVGSHAEHGEIETVLVDPLEARQPLAFRIG